MLETVSPEKYFCTTIQEKHSCLSKNVFRYFFQKVQSYVFCNNSRNIIWPNPSVFYQAFNQQSLFDIYEDAALRHQILDPVYTHIVIGTSVKLHSTKHSQA